MDRFPDVFVERASAVLGGRGELERMLATQSRNAVRVNTLKTTKAVVKARLHALGFETEDVPFCDDAVFIHDPKERAIGSIWEHQAGFYFSQDAASTIPVEALEPRPGDRVLDLCAAPGGKTGHIASRMQNTGMVVANEPNPGRLNNMVSNLDRVGCLNVVSVKQDGARLAWPIAFDRVLVDAPCSNLGGLHDDWRPAFRFDPARVGTLVGTQRSLLTSAFHACRPGGVIVYSTCTIEPSENEGVVSWFLDNYPVEIDALDLGIKQPGLTSMGETTYHDDAAKALRVHPGDVGTDGFFVARFRVHEGEPAAPINARRYRAKRSQYEPSPDDVVGAVAAGYGFDDKVLEGVRTVDQSAKRVFGTTVPDLDEALALGPQRIGMYLASRETIGFRLGFDASMSFGRHADHTLQLAPEHVRAWMSGGTSPIEPGGTWSVVACGDEVLGAGRPFGAELPSFVPKERRVPAEGDLVGFLM